MPQKRIAAIHDLSCFGKCSLAVVLPVISCFGMECALLPTALLSGHFAALPQVTVTDLSAQMQAAAENWKAGSLAFDGIFSGYLASAEQAELVGRFVEEFRGENTLYIADPAMADRGKFYRGFGPEQAEAMKKLCAKADIALPNVTEACLLLGQAYTESPTEEFVKDLLDGMTALGAKKTVITGVSLSPGQVGIACFDGNRTQIFQHPRTEGHFNGTGDLFAAVLTAAAVEGKDLMTAAKQAMEFTAKVIARTAQNPHHRSYGVDFEPCLADLVKDKFFTE